MTDFALLNATRLRQVLPEPLHAFAERTGVELGQLVPVERTCIGDFARDEDDNLVWVEV